MSKEQRIIGDLQERNAILQQCIEDMLEAETLGQAKDEGLRCLEALTAVENITPRPPMWIGIEIPTIHGFYRVCLGLNQDDGHELSFLNEADIEHSENGKYCPWNFEGDLSISYGIDGRVFDDKHELIKNKNNE